MTGVHADSILDSCLLTHSSWQVIVVMNSGLVLLVSRIKLAVGSMDTQYQTDGPKWLMIEGRKTNSATGFILHGSDVAMAKSCKSSTGTKDDTIPSIVCFCWLEHRSAAILLYLLRKLMYLSARIEVTL